MRIHYKIMAFRPFDEEAELTVSNELGTFLLVRELLTVQLAQDSGSIQDAYDAVNSYLRAWELEAELRSGIDELRFEPAWSVVLPEDHNEGELFIAHRRYPAPPSIRVTPEMEAIWSRFKRPRRFLADSDIGYAEPVQSAAYYCLTVVEKSAGGRVRACGKYNIERELLNQVGELTSTRGGFGDARKFNPAGAVPLLRAEKRWIDRAIRLIVLQMGLVAAGPLPEPLTMDSVAES